MIKTRYVVYTPQYFLYCIHTETSDKIITYLNAAVLLCSTSGHQTLDVDASKSHIGVYSSLLSKTISKK